ncbi:MAG: ATP-binding protein [Pseudobdellovibrionaceae bacterium]|nr:ATP-binding protein [Bdellovibrionales bacterium]USN48826.1 MAG: ATP-binding protein [Pseudobdellovibrionaceae bacterium]
MIQRSIKLPESQSFFLFGPRGSGKSTLLRQHFAGKDPLWIDLLDPGLEFRIAQNPNEILELWKGKRSPWIVIDEVQKQPQLLDLVHKAIEEHKIKFALTGSSARKLKRGGANLLAGRAVEKHLYPFSSIELGDQFELQKALEFGLLPTIWDSNWNREEKTDFLYSYVNTYLKEEIAAEQLVRNLDPFRRFLVAAAQSNGKIINHSKIERDSGVSSKQSQRHFEILVDTLMGFYLEPFDTSIRKRQTLKSKFYFFDTGVIRALNQLAGESLIASTFEYGDLFETFVVNEFVKSAKALNKRWQFSYYRTSNDVEVDLIIEKPRGKKVLVEIKSFSKFDREKVESYFRISKEFKSEVAYLLSNDPTAREVDGVRCLHWQQGIDEIFFS